MTPSLPTPKGPLLLRSIFLLLATLSLAPAPASSAKLLVKGCVKAGTFDRNADYFSTAFRNQQFARAGRTRYRFSVRYHRYYKVVTDLVAGTVYVLTLCGAPAPPASAGGASAVRLSIPLRSYAVSGDLMANFLQMLGVQGQLKAAPAGSMVDPCMQRVVARLRSTFPVPLPTLSAFFSPSDYRGMNISFSASMESSPLRRAEWVKYLALFFNAEDRANVVYSRIYASYLCNRRRAAPSAGVRKPRVVAWLSFYDGTWTLSAAEYKLQYASDAGGTNPARVAKRRDASFSMSSAADVAAFRGLLASVDVVIDESYLATGPAGYRVADFRRNARLTEAQAAAIPFLRTQNLWGLYGQYTPGSFLTGWFEGAVAQPQIVLQELVAIVKPAEYPKGVKHTFLYNVARGGAKAVTAASCRARNIYAAVNPSPAGC